MTSLIRKIIIYLKLIAKKKTSYWNKISYLLYEYQSLIQILWRSPAKKGNPVYGTKMYSCTTSTLTKYWEKKLYGNYMYCLFV